MKAAIFRKFSGPISVEEVPDPELPPDGAIIQVGATGLCRSDWHGWMGHDADVTLPHVPGHELAGIIEETGRAVRRWEPGQRVTLPFAGGCGICDQCLAGNQHICDDYFQPGFTAWGSFAERVAVRYADVNLVRLPDEIDFATAAALGCRFVTSFRAVVDQGRVSGGQWVTVHGCGGVGLSAIMIAAAMGAQVIGIDINEEALALARNAGATFTLNAAHKASLIEAIHDLSHGGAHLAIDALGSAETCRNSILSLRKQGRHVQVGLMNTEDSDPPLPMGQVVARELVLLGSHGLQAHRNPPILAMIGSGQLDPGLLVTRRIPLQKAPEALEAMGTFSTAGITVIDRF